MLKLEEPVVVEYNETLMNTSMNTARRLSLPTWIPATLIHADGCKYRRERDVFEKCYLHTLRHYRTEATYAYVSCPFGGAQTSPAKPE